MIAHIDMDCFFASVEMAQDESLRDIPIAISSNSKRSAIATCNYPARKFGVRSAMPTFKAIQLCPDLTVVVPKKGQYSEYSRRVFEIISKFDIIIEKVSIDEAYLDLEQYSASEAKDLMEKIREDIENELNITASVGIARNKFFAKICSDINKPNGIYVLRKEDENEFLENLPISKFRGVGKKTYMKMVDNKILNGKMLKDKTMEQLIELFGVKRADWFYNISRGIDYRAVNPHEKERKSISSSETFSKNTSDDKFCKIKLMELCEKVGRRAVSENLYGKTVTVKIKFPDFTIQTRSKTIEEYTNSKMKMFEVCSMLITNDPLTRKIRLMGVTLSNFQKTNEDVSLW